jgi:hypothetical protein
VEGNGREKLKFIGMDGLGAGKRMEGEYMGTRE